jgi:hypothetical protein
MPPETCPNCGADVPPQAKACPECGACDRTGWAEDADFSAGDLGVPEESFDYNEFVEREFGRKKNLPPGISRFWWVVSLVIAVILLMFVLSGLWR